jgi:hypothetical protein
MILAQAIKWSMPIDGALEHLSKAGLTENT